MDTKECKKCKLIKSLSEFHSNRVKYKTPNCKQCISESSHTINLKRYYGMSAKQFQEMLIKQNHCCAICKQKETAIYASTNKTKLLSVDHCHTTGKIRGLLCSNCNHGIGKFKNNSDLLLIASEYLKTV